MRRYTTVRNTRMGNDVYALHGVDVVVEGRVVPHVVVLQNLRIRGAVRH